MSRSPPHIDQGPGWFAHAAFWLKRDTLAAKDPDALGEASSIKGAEAEALDTWYGGASGTEDVDFAPAREHGEIADALDILVC